MSRSDYVQAFLVAYLDVVVLENFGIKKL